jgi:hypothetical protein
MLICCAAMIMLMWEENYGDISDANRKPAAVNNNVEIKPRKLDFGYLKKHSSIRHLNDDEIPSDEDENVSSLQEVESQSNGNSDISDGARSKHHTDGMFATLWNGMVTVWRSPPILMCCIIGSCFEGAM